MKFLRNNLIKIFLLCSICFQQTSIVAFKTPLNKINKNKYAVAIGIANKIKDGLVKNKVYFLYGTLGLGVFVTTFCVLVKFFAKKNSGKPETPDTGKIDSTNNGKKVGESDGETETLESLEVKPKKDKDGKIIIEDELSGSAKNGEDISKKKKHKKFEILTPEDTKNNGNKTPEEILEEEILEELKKSPEQDIPLDNKKNSVSDSLKKAKSKKHVPTESELPVDKFVDQCVDNSLKKKKEEKVLEKKDKKGDLKKQEKKECKNGGAKVKKEKKHKVEDSGCQIKVEDNKNNNSNIEKKPEGKLKVTEIKKDFKKEDKVKDPVFVFGSCKINIKEQTGVEKLYLLSKKLNPIAANRCCEFLNDFPEEKKIFDDLKKIDDVKNKGFEDDDLEEEGEELLTQD